MTSLTPRRLFRTAAITFALALATTTGASADVLTPLEDTGGPGGGSGFGGQIDETARAQDLQALTGGDAVAGAYDDLLAGSGYETAAAQAEAPTVAEARSAETAAAQSSQEDVLAGSGYEQQDTAVAHHPTQNELSIQRIESAQTATGALAGGEDTTAAINGRGQVAYAETEHALAQNASASAELAPQATHPNRTAF